MDKLQKNIPNHWKWVILENISKKITDGSHNPPKGIETGIPMLSAKNIQNNSIDFSDARYLTDEDFEIENQRTSLETSDILLTTVGTIGRVALVPNNSKFVLQRSVTVIKPLINPKFLLYYFQSNEFQKKLNENATGTAQKGIYLNVIKQLEIPLAPLEEQSRIVEKIEELFSELDKNLQQFNKCLINIDNLWELSLNKQINNKSPFLIRLGSFISIKGGKRLPKNANYSNQKTQYPYIRVTDFLNYSIDESNLKYINEDVYGKLEKYSIENNEIYISIAGTIGLVGSIPNSITSAILTENAAKLSINNKSELIKDYLIYVLDSPFVKDQITKSIKATSQPKLALYKIAEIQIPKHSLREQKEIIEKLDELKNNCDRLKTTINENILATENLKSKILQEAFLGKLSTRLNTDSSTESLLKEIKICKENYLIKQQEIIKNRPKIKRMEKEKLSIIQVLEKHKKPISSIQLWEDSMFSNNIEIFYAELKKVQNKIKQEKIGSKTLISLV